MSLIKTKTYLILFFLFLNKKKFTPKILSLFIWKNVYFSLEYYNFIARFKGEKNYNAFIEIILISNLFDLKMKKNVKMKCKNSRYRRFCSKRLFWQRT